MNFQELSTFNFQDINGNNKDITYKDILHKLECTTSRSVCQAKQRWASLVLKA